jgi:hypothetical protein
MSIDLSGMFFDRDLYLKVLNSKDLTNEGYNYEIFK